MALKDQLLNKTPDEKAELKARWFSELSLKTFTRGAYTVNLSNLRRSGKVVSVDVSVIKGGVEVLKETFNITNPPILVPDGTTHMEDFVRPNGEIISRPVDNYKEDPAEALKQILIDQIKRRV